jgi:hypothetical protein
MTKYTITPNDDSSGFNISIAGSNGARQTMLGFQSEAEAKAWILHDKRLSEVPAPQMPNASASAPG